MLKKIFLTLLAIVVLSNGSLAKSNNETNTNNSNELKPEPYFDLPKKDAKEQCEEVERVYSYCLSIVEKTDHKMVRCGNVYIDEFTTDGEDLHMLILSKLKTKIGITLGKYPDYENGIYIGYIDDKQYMVKNELVDFDFLKKVKYQKFKIKNCYIENYRKM